MLSYVFEVLVARQASPPVLAVIVEMIHSLLTLEDFQATDEVSAIDPGETVTMETTMQGTFADLWRMLLININ